MRRLLHVMKGCLGWVNCESEQFKRTFLEFNTWRVRRDQIRSQLDWPRNKWKKFLINRATKSYKLGQKQAKWPIRARNVNQELNCFSINSKNCFPYFSGLIVFLSSSCWKKVITGRKNHPKAVGIWKFSRATLIKYKIQVNNLICRSWVMNFRKILEDFLTKT